MVQIGEASEKDKPKFASLLKNQSMETITLEDALGLFNLPRSVGKYEGQEIIAGIGKFGPYIRHQNKFYSLRKGNDNPVIITLEDAISLINEKREKDLKKVIKQFPEDKDLQILNGRWGPYIQYRKENFRIPKNVTPEDLTKEQCLEIIDKSKEKKKKSG
jgi:DNA topoisomerase-1